MADPRYERLELPAAGPAAALSVVRRLLATVAEPPIERSAYGRVSLASIPAVAAAAPMATLQSTLTFPPTRRGEVAWRLQTPTVSGWQVTQERSRFGACLRLYGTSAARQVQLDFGGEPGREREEGPRLERFLVAAVEAGVLPPRASVARLLDRFFAQALPGPGRCPPRSLPTMVEGGVTVRVPGWRGRGRSAWGPIGLQLELPACPLDPVLSLLTEGGPCQLVISSTVDPGLAARVAEIGEAAFAFWCGDGHPLDEHVVDALVSAVGEDPLRVDWDCTWPGGGGYLNGVVLFVNATEDPYADPVPAPGEVAVYLSVHPRVDDRHPEAFARRLVRRAGLRLAEER